MLVVVYTIKYVYVYDTVPAWYIHDTCMGHACLSVVRVTGVPELADYLLYFVSLASSSTHHERVNQVTHSSIYGRGRLMRVEEACGLSCFMCTWSFWLNIVGLAEC